VTVKFNSKVQRQRTSRIRVRYFSRRSGWSNDGHDQGGAGHVVISELYRSELEGIASVFVALFLSIMIGGYTSSQEA
jgi:hypothetical protein